MTSRPASLPTTATTPAAFGVEDRRPRLEKQTGANSGMNSSIRISLHRRKGSLASYQATCISKHYALNNQILVAFENHYENELWQVAFFFGLQFCETALLEIPKHGYFYANKFASLRMQSSIDAMRVTHLLQDMIAKDPPLLAGECHKVERLFYLAREQYENLSTYERERHAVELELQAVYGAKGLGSSSTNNNRRGGPESRSTTSTTTSSSLSSLTSSLIACGDSFASILCPGGGSHQAGFPLTTGETKMPDDSSSTNPWGEFPPPGRSLAFQPEEHVTTDNDKKFPPEQRQPDEGSNNDLFPSSASRNKGSLIDDDEKFLSGDRKEEDDGPSPPQRRMGRHAAAPVPHDVPSEAVVARTHKPQRFSSGASDFEGSIPTRPMQVRTRSDYDLQRALFLSGIEVKNSTTTSTSEAKTNNDDDQRHLPSVTESHERNDQDDDNFLIPAAPPGAKKRESVNGLSMAMLTDFYHEDFDDLRDTGRVQICHFPTFQGRVPDSTNGCTIIAPLLCMHHFLDDNVIPDNGLSDHTIVSVIDDETPNILPLVRQSLGLVKNAFLIPVDAHACLMEQHYMCQEQFRTVCGGNLMEAEHLQPLLDELSIVGPKKLAATFFFHEHVITILQLRRNADRNSVWFDIIDSLPHSETLLKCGEEEYQTTDRNNNNNNEEKEEEEKQWMSDSHHSSSNDSSRFHGSRVRSSSGSGLENGGGGSSMSEEEFLAQALEVSKPLNGVRIRCGDVESLKVTLLWYACSVFTEENKAYIDTYHWDENLCDFDPRVFQAFIWNQV